MTFGFPDPKTAEIPMKHGETQQDQDWPHHRDWPQIRQSMPAQKCYQRTNGVTFTAPPFKNALWPHIGERVAGAHFNHSLDSGTAKPTFLGDFWHTSTRAWVCQTIKIASDHEYLCPWVKNFRAQVFPLLPMMGRELKKQEREEKGAKGRGAGGRATQQKEIGERR